MPKTVSTSQKSVTPSVGSFRPELQGLRALAVGLVLLFHLWPGRLSGGFVGVDVFFVVSGFLITSHLYRELSTTGTIVLSKFWARRIMRLLPLAFTVLVVSFVAMILFVPQTVWDMNVRQILGSLFYVENWILAIDSVDYMAAENEASLVQHYWSLSIEEQFYVLLPLVLLGAYGLARVISKPADFQTRDPKRLMMITLGLIIVASLIFSIAYTNHNAAQAYFVTPTRFWEFAAGGLLALMPLPERLSDKNQNALGLLGLGAIVAAALWFDGATPFPGYTALLPVLGTILFIRYGSHRKYSGVYWWASQKPVTKMGDWSYAIYLWHWPLIIVATYQLDDFSWPYKLVLIVVTFVLSALSQRYVEDPFRRAPTFKVPKRAFALMASNMAIIALVTYALPQALVDDDRVEVTVSECIGADAFLSDCDERGLEGDPLVSALQVQQEAEEPSYPQCNVPDGFTDFDRSGCSLGSPEDGAELKIAVLGDSHARAWLPMFDELGKKQNWNIQGYTKSGCTPVPLSSAGPGADQTKRDQSAACVEFIEDSSEEFLNDSDIDIVVTAASPTDRIFYDHDGSKASSETAVSDALSALWNQWSDSGKQVVVIGELPHFDDLNAPTCVISASDAIVDECSVARAAVAGDRGTLLADTVQKQDVDAYFYNPVPGVCDDQRCYSMVGQLITRYDQHHLSSDFARSFEENFLAFLGDRDLVSF